MQFDAIVVGAGPAGSSIARLLAEHGWAVALVEKMQFPRPKVCGEFISAATLPLLETSGIGSDFFAAAGPPVDTVALYAGRTLAQSSLPVPGRALGRERLDRMLRDAAVAAGAILFQPSECRNLTQWGAGISCTLANGDVLAARIGIAATGSWNKQGHFSLHAATENPSDLFAFKTHFRQSTLPEGTMPLLAFPGGYGGMVHSDAGRTSLSCCIRRDALGKARARHGGRAGEAVLAHIKETTSGAMRALDSAIHEEAWLGTGPIRPGSRPVYSHGIFRVGNLAGEAHPIIAEGISMAIQSARLLAQMLIAHSPDRAAEAYRIAWRNRFTPRVAAASVFAHLAMNDLSRPLMAALVSVAPFLLTGGAVLAGKANALRR